VSSQLGLSEEIFVLDLWTGTLNVNTTLVTAFTAAILVTPLGALSVVSRTIDPSGKERITSPDLACFFRTYRWSARSCQSSSYKRLSPSSSVPNCPKGLSPSIADKREYLGLTGLAGLCVGHSRGHHLSVSTTIFAEKDRSTKIRHSTIQFECTRDAKRRDDSRFPKALGGKSCTKWSTASCYVADHFVRFLNSQLVSCTWSWRSMYGSRANPYLICCSAGFLSWGKWRLPTVSSPPC